MKKIKMFQSRMSIRIPKYKTALPVLRVSNIKRLTSGLNFNTRYIISGQWNLSRQNLRKNLKWSRF